MAKQKPAQQAPETEVTEQAEDKPAKKQTEVKTVTMDSGKVIEFPGKRRIQKESFIDSETNSVKVSFYLVNGKTLTHSIRPDMLLQFAAHGAGQKIADQVAGMKDEKGNPADIEDLALEMEDLIDQLDRGEWTSRVPGESTSGMSLLLQAIINITGKPRDQIKKFLATLDKKSKTALSVGKKYGPEVKRLRDERDAKKPAIDVSAFEDAIDALPAA